MIAFFHLTIVQNNYSIVINDNSKPVGNRNDGSLYPTDTVLKFEVCLVIDGGSCFIQNDD